MGRFVCYEIVLINVIINIIIFIVGRFVCSEIVLINVIINIIIFIVGRFVCSEIVLINVIINIIIFILDCISSIMTIGNEIKGFALLNLKCTFACFVNYFICALSKG